MKKIHRKIIQIKANVMRRMGAQMKAPKFNNRHILGPYKFGKKRIKPEVNTQQERAYVKQVRKQHGPDYDINRIKQIIAGMSANHAARILRAVMAEARTMHKAADEPADFWGNNFGAKMVACSMINRRRLRGENVDYVKQLIPTWYIFHKLYNIGEAR